MQRSNTSGKNPTPNSPDRNQDTSSTESTSPSSSGVPEAASFMMQDPPASITNNQSTLATVALARPDDSLMNVTSNLDMLAAVALMTDAERVQAALQEQGTLETQQEQAPSSSPVMRTSVIQQPRMHPYQQGLENRHQAPQDHSSPIQQSPASLLHTLLIAPSSLRPQLAANPSPLHALLLTPPVSRAPSSLQASLARPQLPPSSSIPPQPQAQAAPSIPQTSQLKPTFLRPQLPQTSASSSPFGETQKANIPTGYFRRPRELDSLPVEQGEQSTRGDEPVYLRYRKLPEALKNIDPSKLPARFRLTYIPNFDTLPVNTEQPNSMDALKALILARLRAGVGRTELSYELEYRFPNLSWHPSPGQISAIAREAARTRIEGKGKGKGKNRQDKD